MADRRTRPPRARLVVIGAAMVVASGMVGAGFTTTAGGEDAAPAQSPAPFTVPKANCGPSDRPETGLQGQVPYADRVSGRASEGYWCNLQLIGQFAGEGASWQHASFGDCGYFSTAETSSQQGTVVVDASDPSNPRKTAVLTADPFRASQESMKVNQSRALLGAVRRGRAGVDSGLALYDVSGDCTQPRLVGNRRIEGLVGHAGDFSPDGLTYYATQEGDARLNPPSIGWTAIDISDPANPLPLYRHVLDLNLTGFAHDLSVSKDGMRLYVGQPHPGEPGLPGANGLVILDVSDIQLRRPNPQVHVVSTLFWLDGTCPATTSEQLPCDGSVAQVPLPVKIGGRQYIIFTDEMGSGGFLGHGSTARSCASGLPPFGFARIIDITDEKHPVTVSKLRLEVTDPANCASVLADESSVFAYDSHYCAVDNEQNARLLACSHFQAGIRVFDIRDPARPREIAYYIPPARPTAVQPGSSNTFDRTADWATAKPRFRVDRGEIWFTSTDNGFQIVRLSNAVWPLRGDDTRR